MNPTLETEFTRACFKRRNQLRRKAAAEYHRLLFSFLALGLLLILLACAGIALRWSPGQQTDSAKYATQTVVEGLKQRQDSRRRETEAN